MKDSKVIVSQGTFFVLVTFCVPFAEYDIISIHIHLAVLNDEGRLPDSV